MLTLKIKRVANDNETMGWLAGFMVLGAGACMQALADDGPFGLFNPLGLYAGASVGRSDLDQTQFDYYAHDYHRLDGEPFGWNAYVGVRPIPFLGAEGEFIDFGNSRRYGTPGSDAHDRAAGLFAVGYLPVPLPFFEPFAKLGWAQIWEHDNFSGVSTSIRPNGFAYGGGLQFHFSQLAVRAQYERIDGDRSLGFNDPGLLSVGVNWTF